MNLADPFGRIKAKHQKEYESLCASLVKADISTTAQAEALQLDVRRRARWTILGALVITILLSVIFTAFIIIFISLGVLFCFWAFKTALNGNKYIQRYIDEELNQDLDSNPVE